MKLRNQSGVGLIEVMVASVMVVGMGLYMTNRLTSGTTSQRNIEIRQTRDRLVDYYRDLAENATAITNTENAADAENVVLKDHIDGTTSQTVTDTGADPIAPVYDLNLYDQNGNKVVDAGGLFLNREGRPCTPACTSTADAQAKWQITASWLAHSGDGYSIHIQVEQINRDDNELFLKIGHFDPGGYFGGESGESGSDVWDLNGGDINFSSGNVGINTSTPSTALEIITEASGEQPILQRNQDDTPGSNLLFYKSRGTNDSPSIVNAFDYTITSYLMGYDGSNYGNAGHFSCLVYGTPGAGDMPGGCLFYVSADGGTTLAEVFRFGPGQVGIGTGSLAEELTVNGYVSGTNLIWSSDRALKKNIQSIRNTEYFAEKVRQLRPVTFEWKDPPKGKKTSSHKKEIGFIAQEVEAVFKDAEFSVVEGPEGHKGIKTSAMVVSVLAATQHSQNRIDNLQAQQIQQKERLAKLKQRLHK